MKTPMLSLILLFSTGVALAQTPAPPAPSAKPATETSPSRAEKPRDDDHRCLRHTGSTITASRNQRDFLRRDGTSRQRCAPVAGRAYSREELERTGAGNLRDALRMLDPAVH